jgi:holo-[acyl-carrier protein] synthase
MLKGIGIDLVEIERFSHWESYYGSRLQKVFTQEEIDYCLKNRSLSAARFATRFAAKEALYKALSPYLAPSTSFQSLCRHCSLTVSATGPHMNVNWEKLGFPLGGTNTLQVHLSLTHTATTAGAVVICETADNPN